ncbi:ABC transporter substrate-binding protein [Paenibacillus alginolyticus]|uniref:ABC transporter substrate-binding protein n=1 Tax=Paenibacillus alginolyticus TaxID=59839 RepID=A0ABT4GKZ0_9BACL|nr:MULTISPECIES: ABC transporter substrate-binding protein [Paenibacillus]MCY9667274.1 ABC transporter substrate-binding protein [Paenibacillus alginolyticus]MCY9696875.1 ABC transporter substrate-binding protein [Paenibacillus alginolyticus]MEC0142035.1 ABC transporter substrate-binding protein [Paenibacillus alginolyticus]NRF95308.1 extracellular solute-binding protein [Paenibacillus frigoriresistens]
MANSKKMKRAVMLSAATLLLLMTACTNTTQPAADGNTSKPAATTDNKGTDSKKDDIKPITFTMFSEDINQNYENMQSPVGKKITELTGVSLKIDYPVGDAKQKVSLMAASNDYPDFIYAKGDSNLIVNAGGFIDLAPLIDKYAPNLKKLYGDYMKRLRWNKDDKAIYTLGAYGVGQQQWEPATGFELQHGVVKELGYPKLRTIQDFENAIKTYKDKHPTVDGQPTIGLSLLADDWRILISVTNPAVFATGGPDDGEWYVDPKTQKAVYHFTRPEEKEYFKWLNHMNDIGLLDPESFVQKYDQYQAKISSGRVLGLIDAKWEYQQAEQALKKAGKEDQTYGLYPLTLNDSIKYHDFQDSGYSGGWGIGISKTCKDPVRAIKFLDWLATEPAQILNNWGIEGVNYKIENGKRVISPEEMEQRNKDPQYGKKTGIGVYAYPFPTYGDGVKDSTGQTYTIKSQQQIIDAYSNTDKEVLSKYNAKMWKDLYPQPSDFPVKPYGAAWQINIPQDTDAALIFQKAEDLMKKRIPEAILAKPDKFDSIWDNFMKELEQAGVHKMEDQFNKLLQDRIQQFTS